MTRSLVCFVVAVAALLGAPSRAVAQRVPPNLTTDSQYVGGWRTDYNDSTRRHWLLILDADGGMRGVKSNDSGATAFYKGSWGAAFGTFCFFSPHDQPDGNGSQVIDAQCYSLSKPSADTLRIGSRSYYRVLNPLPEAAK